MAEINRFNRILEMGNRTRLSNMWTSGNKIVLFGDSIVAQDGVADIDSVTKSINSRGAFQWANVFLNQAFDIIKYSGLAGNDSSEMLARIQTDVIAYSPDYCYIPLTSNDMNLLFDTAANIQSRYTQMFDLLTAAGIKIITTTCVSSDYYFDEGTTEQKAAKKTAWHGINYWIKNYVKDHPNIILVDVASVGTDASTGRPITNYTDGTHPYGVLAIRMGKLIADTVSPFIKQVDSLPYTNIDEKNVLTNGLFLGNTGGVATSWSVEAGTGATQTPSKAARTDGKAGAVQVVEITVAGTTPSNVYTGSIVHSFDVGDEIYAECEFEATTTDLKYIYAHLIFQNDSFASTAGSYGMFFDSGNPDIDYPSISGVLRTAPIPVKTGDTRVRLFMRFIGVGTFKFKRARIWKVES